MTIRIWGLNSPVKIQSNSLIPTQHRQSEALNCTGLVLDDCVDLSKETLSVLRHHGALGEPSSTITPVARKTEINPPSPNNLHSRRFFKPLPSTPEEPGGGMQEDVGSQFAEFDVVKDDAEKFRASNSEPPK